MLRLLTQRDFHRQGAALVVALMIMLILAGMGLIAVQTSVQDMRVTSNFRRDRQAQYVAEAGMMTAMAQVGQAGDAYWTFMKQSILQGQASEAKYTFNNDTFTGVLFTGPNGDVTNLDPSVNVVMQNPLDGGQMPGYSDEFCFKSFDFISTGAVGASNPTVQLDNSYQRFATRRFAATAMLGPIECEGN